MLKSEIKPGTEYAMREKRKPQAELQRVRILEHIRRNKWKACWISPNPGLVDYVESAQLVCAWNGHKAFLKEEDDRRRLREHNLQLGYKEQSPVVSAVQQVFESVGDDVSFDGGVLYGPPEAIERLKARAQITEALESPVAYVDRAGKVHLPFDQALEIARKFCAAEPSAVLVGVEATERDWSMKATQRDGDYIVPLLNEYRASWAIIRQWTGHDAAVAQREAEIQRLERLVWDAMYALQKAGLDREATKLRRVLEKQ